ncbi:Transport permease protein [Hyphomicrobium sp. 1Nfss2.1]
MEAALCDQRRPVADPHPGSAALAYARDIFAARYFWWHLALSDLRSRWRRSYLGILWSILQPLGITILISIVFSRLLNASFLDYAPYVLSGIIFWEFFASTVSGGSLAFVQNEPYIKQCRHPLAIYTLRTVLANLVVTVVASLALVIVVLVLKPGTLSWAWLAWFLALPVLLFTAWPLATALAYVSVRFRDVPYALGLAMQTLWFISPVYFDVKLFRSAGLDGLVDYNPIYHLLELTRAPFLRGEWPSLANYGVCLATIAGLATLAIVLGRRMERRVMFYL